MAGPRWAEDLIRQEGLGAVRSGWRNCPLPGRGSVGVTGPRGGPCSAGACLGLAAVGPGGPGNLASETAVWAVIRVGHGIRSWAGLSHRAAGWIVPRPPLPGPGGAGPVVGMESRAATGDLGSQSPCGACLHRVAGCRPVGSAEDLGAVRYCPVLPGRKFQSHPGVPPGRLIELAPSSLVLGCGVRVAAQGSRTPFASPNGEQQGGFGVDPPPPVLARRVGCPRLRGLGWRRPRGACRVTWCGWWLADTFSVVPVGA